MHNPFEEISKQLANNETMLAEILRRLDMVSKPGDDKPMDIKAAAAYLNRPVSTLYNLVRKQEIPHSVILRRLYFNRAELAAWVAAGGVKTTTQLVIEADNILTKKSR